MSIYRRYFGSIFIGAIMILVGLDIILALQSIGLAVLISANLMVLGTLLLFRGFVEKDFGDRRFYFLWGLVLLSISFSVAISLYTSALVGFAMLLICLGAIAIFVAMHR